MIVSLSVLRPQPEKQSAAAIVTRNRFIVLLLVPSIVANDSSRMARRKREPRITARRVRRMHRAGIRGEAADGTGGDDCRMQTILAPCTVARLLPNRSHRKLRERFALQLMWSDCHWRGHRLAMNSSA